MRRALSWLAAVILFAGLCWLFPPFRVVPLHHAREQQRQSGFDPAAFARGFWDKQLLPAADRAATATELLSLLAHDPDSARKRFGHSPGLSSAVYFFVRGSGQVTAIKKDRVEIALDEGQTNTPVALLTGLLFGNAVRDASGLLNVSDYPNSQDFNDLSTELNRLVESRVFPELTQRAAVGKAVRFVGCMELPEGTVPTAVEIVPVKIDWP
jgi:predicted lipoprotein